MIDRVFVEHFKSVYSNKDGATYLKNESIKVEETTDNIDIKIVNFDNNLAQVISFDFEKRIRDFYTKTDGNNISFQKGADGALIFEHNNKQYLFLVELKNQLTRNSLKNVKQQFQITSVRAKNYLDLFEGFDTENIKVICILVSQPKKAVSIEENTVVLKGRLLNPKSEHELLIQNNKLIVEVSELEQYNLKKKYHLNSFPLHFINGNDKTVKLSDFIED